MIYEGKFEKVVSTTEGDKKDGTGKWKKVVFLAKTKSLACFMCWTDQAETVLNLKQGDKITIECDIESREYNSRYYTDVVARKVTLAEVGEKTPLQQKQEAKLEEDDSGLPF